MVHEADGASGSTAVMTVESVDRMCSLQAADVEEGRQNESALAPEHAPEQTVEVPPPSVGDNPPLAPPLP